MKLKKIERFANTLNSIARATTEIVTAILSIKNLIKRVRKDKAKNERTNRPN